MNHWEDMKTPRAQIGIRLAITLLCLILFEVLKLTVQITVLFQFVYLFLTQRHNQPLRNFSNKIATYAYKLIRYATLNDNQRPFPFSEFPSEMEPPVDTVTFGREI